MLKLWWRMCGCCLFAKVEYLRLIGDMIIRCVLYTIRDIDNDLMSSAVGNLVASIRLT